VQYVIIGAGPAGVTAAENLRKIDPDGIITLVGDEPEMPYSRMAIPYLLINQIDERGTFLRKDDEHYKRSGIAIVQGKVVSVDQTEKTVGLQGGTKINYDKLLIATGSTPLAPPIPGIDLPGVTSCWTLEDARHIARVAKPGSKVVLMGAGFIGCIILEALAKSGADLTVVEMEDRMVPRMMNDIAGTMIKDWCQHNGVNVHTSTKVNSISQDDGSLLVELSTSHKLIADMVVSATGVKPNTSALDTTDVKIEEGVLVDKAMRTSDENIFAAGDVAQAYDFSTGEMSVQAIQPTAVEHGALAAKNMAGQTQATHRGSVNMNVLDTLGLISSSFGLWMGVTGGDSAELLNKERFKYINLQFQDDILVGATSLGLTQHVGVLRGLIQSKIKLGVWKERLMKDPTRIMEAYLGATQAIGFNADVMK
jgi:NAD(P)H-nitrite reductase large subunit